MLDSIESSSLFFSLLSTLMARWRRFAFLGVGGRLGVTTATVGGVSGGSKLGPGSCGGRVGVCGRVCTDMVSGSPVSAVCVYVCVCEESMDTAVHRLTTGLDTLVHYIYCHS